MEEIRELIQREIIDSNVLHNHADLADLSRNYISSSAGNFLNMATYRLKEIGFKWVEKGVSGKKVSYYSKED